MNNIKKLILILSVLIVFAGCKPMPNQKENAVYYTVVDDYGRTVSLKTEPQKIVSVSPGITEILYALQAGDRLAGRSEFCVYPEEVRQIPSVGGISDVNVEKIIELKPDLVLIGSMVPKQVVDFLTEAEINVIAVKEKNTFSGVYENIERVGAVVNKQKEAEQLTDSLKAVLAKVRNDQRGDKPKVYYVVGYGKSGDYTAGGDTYIQSMISLAGGKNIAEDLNGWLFSRELLFERDPDYIFIRTEDYSAFIHTRPYTELTAVKKERVFPIESALMDVQGPRSVQAVQFISEIIHQK